MTGSHGRKRQWKQKMQWFGWVCFCLLRLAFACFRLFLFAWDLFCLLGFGFACLLACELPCGWRFFAVFPFVPLFAVYGPILCRTLRRNECFVAMGIRREKFFSGLFPTRTLPETKILVGTESKTTETKIDTRHEKNTRSNGQKPPKRRKYRFETGKSTPPIISIQKMVIRMHF